MRTVEPVTAGERHGDRVATGASELRADGQARGRRVRRRTYAEVVCNGAYCAKHGKSRVDWVRLSAWRRGKSDRCHACRMHRAQAARQAARQAAVLAEVQRDQNDAQAAVRDRDRFLLDTHGVQRQLRAPVNVPCGKSSYVTMPLFDALYDVLVNAGHPDAADVVHDLANGEAK